MNLRESEDSVLHGEAWVQPALSNEDGLIQPGIPGVAGFKSRSDPEVLVFESGLPGHCHGRLHFVIHVKEPVIAHIDERSIVGFYLDTHVEAPKSVGADKNPVTTATDESSADAIALDLAARRFKEHSSPKRTIANRNRWLQHGVIRHFVNEFHHYLRLGEANEVSAPRRMLPIFGLVGERADRLPQTCTWRSFIDIGPSIGSAYYDGENWEGMVELVRAADRLGVTYAWIAEASGMETIAPLAYLAAVTERIKLDTGIMQISARTPAMTAMTALSMARLSNDRFCLGLGVSGPQVVEGLHGEAFAGPLGRLREYIAIVRQGISGERISFQGEYYVLPRPGGEGRALKLSMPPKPAIPIYLAAFGPKMLELTGEVSDGWLGTSFIPEAAEGVLSHIRAGADRVGRSLADLDLRVNATIEISDDVDALVAKCRPGVTFTLGAMGSANTNFYNAAFTGAGWGDVAKIVQALWVGGDKASAIAAVPDEFVLAGCASGTIPWSAIGYGRSVRRGSTRYG